MRRLVASACGGAVMFLSAVRPCHGRTPSVFLQTASRYVHEALQDEQTTPQQRQEAARDALLAFNIMIDQGIEPDVEMYTTLMATMGKAGYEWQAFKLFSRLLEQGLQPLPETYLALKRATNRKRVKLRGDIDAKIENAILSLPHELDERQQQIEAEEELRSQQLFEEATTAEQLPKPEAVDFSTVASPHSSTGSSRQVPRPDAEGNIGVSAAGTSSIPTMHISGPDDVWSTYKYLGELRGKQQWYPDSDGESKPHRKDTKNAEIGATARESLYEELVRVLHIEEMKTYLATRRQLRHWNTKEELARHIIATVNPADIRAMLQRRNRYFRSVQYVLEEQLKEAGVDAATDRDKAKEITASMAQGPSSATSSNSLTKIEKFDLDPMSLKSPWGLIPKPPRRPPTERTQRKLENDDSLTKEELAEMYNIIVLKKQRPELTQEDVDSTLVAIDTVPERNLRRYARMHGLKWKRRVPGELESLVAWHLRRFPPGTTDEAAYIAETGNLPPSLRESEDTGLRQTLDAFDVYRIVAHRCEGSVQVVDAAAVNKKVQQEKERRRYLERQNDELRRREKYVSDAEAMHRNAREVRIDVDDDRGSRTSVLGLEEARDFELQQQRDAMAPLDQSDDVRESERSDGNTADPDNSGITMASIVDQLQEGSHQRDAEVEYAGHVALQQRLASHNVSSSRQQEIPPWALHTHTGGHRNFIPELGTFGERSQGRYVEQFDQKIRIQDNADARHKYDLDLGFMPRDEQDAMRRRILLKEHMESEERQSADVKRRENSKFQRFAAFCRRAQRKKLQEKQKKRAEGTAPLPRRYRMATQLVKGREPRWKDRMSEA